MNRKDGAGEFKTTVFLFEVMVIGGISMCVVSAEPSRWVCDPIGLQDHMCLLPTLREIPGRRDRRRCVA